MLEIGHVDALPAGQMVFDLLAGFRVGVLEILKDVRVFQIEKDRAVLAVDLEGAVVFAAPGVARAFERAHRAVGEKGQKHAGVVDVYRLDLASVGMLALANEGLSGGHDALDRAVEPLGRVNRVGQQVAGHAGAGHFGVQPPEGHAALGHVGRNGVVLVIHGAVVERPADATLADQLLGQRDGRHAAIVERNHIGHARLLHGRHHLFGLGHVHGQGLFANHHLAVRSRGEDDIVVHDVGDADVDQIDVGACHHLVPVGFHLFVAPGRGKFLQLVAFFLPGAADLEHRSMLAGKKVIDLPVGV